MSNDLLTFHFKDVSLNAIEIDGTPWFVLADVCRVLEISKHRDAASRLDDDERGSVVVDTLGGPQETITVSESGLYSLVLTSRKPQAKPFRKWVTTEVIPTIRKTGKYAIGSGSERGLSEREQRLTKELVKLQDRLLQAERHVAQFNEQIEVCNTIKRMIATGLDDQTIAQAMDTTPAYVAHVRIVRLRDQ
jgi:prophage antirepressor-like protein